MFRRSPGGAVFATQNSKVHRRQAAAAKIDGVRQLAEGHGRTVRFGIRLHTISRDTSAAAWAVADELLAELSPEQIAKQAELHAKSQSVGQRRCTAAGSTSWSHEEVANLIYEYHSAGFDEFILSGYPHLEEAYWFAEGVLPLLRQKWWRETGSAAVLLADARRRCHLLQTPVRDDAFIAEPDCRLVGVVDAVQPHFV